MSGQQNVRAKLSSEVRKLYDKAISAGWTVERRGRTAHLCWRSPTGARVFTSCTPASGAAHKVRRDLRHNGLDV